MKKLLLLLLAMMLCLPFAFAEDATVIDFEDGATGPFGQSGTCSVTVSDKYAHGGTKALAVTGRSGNNWDAADLDPASVGIEQGTPVTLTAWVYVDSDVEGTFCIAKSAGDYGWFGNATVPGKTWTQLTAKFTLEEDVKIRFQNYGEQWNSVDFYIDDVTVELGAAAPAVEVAETTATAFDFESEVPAEFTASGATAPAISTKQAHSGASSLYVTGRTGNNWDAVDLKPDALGIEPFAPVKVTFWVYVDSDEEGTFRLAKGGGDYGTLGKAATFAGKTWTEITAEFSLEQLVSIRFQNSSDNWNNAEFYIDDVTVEVGKVVEVISSEPPMDYKSDFSDGLDGWYPRSGNADAALTVTDEGAIYMTGRTGTWNSPGRDFNLVPGRTYNLSVLVKQDAADTANFILSIATTRDETESYANLTSGPAKKGEWTMYQATYVAGKYDKYVFYVEGGTAEMEFAIKEFTCAEKNENFGQAGLPSLKEIYADKFDLGSAVVGSEVLEEKRMDFYASQFNIFTAGNEMKPDALLDMAETRKAVRTTKDQTTVKVKFDSCIPLLDWAKENNIKVHGHVLVWHSQTPAAFFHEDYATHKPLLDRDTMLARMENYIAQVMTWTNENYPGVIVSWDVVNEAVGDGAKDRVPDNEMKLRKSLWTDVVGVDFVNRAFEIADKYAAEGQDLYYNDYNTDIVSKQVGILKLLDSLIADGHIDGYGFQSHYYAASNSLDKIALAWKNVAAREGLKLRVSELDVCMKDNSEESFAQQAEYYKELFKIYDEYADRIEAVHFWGTVDDLSWRANGYPLLFDGKAQPKPAFWAIAE